LRAVAGELRGVAHHGIASRSVSAAARGRWRARGALMTVFITGAARGVGRATAIAFARRKDAVFVTDICTEIAECPYALATAADLETTVDLCRDVYDDVMSAVVAVRNQQDVDLAVSECIERCGLIDVLVSYAGLRGHAGVHA